MRKITNEELGRPTAEEFAVREKMPVTVVLDNVRSAQNVGAFFRTGDAVSLRDAVLSADSCVQPDRQKIAEKYSYARFAATLRAVISEGKS